MLANLLPMILLCWVGYGLRRLGWLQPEDGRTIGKLLSLLALPAVIFRALATATITPDLIYLPLAAVIVVSGLTLIGLTMARPLMATNRALAGSLATTFPTFEGGAVGYPLMVLAFGDVGLSRIVLFDLAQAIFLLTVVYSLSAWFGQTQVSGQQLLTKLLKTPFFWAIVLGLAANGLGLNRGPLMGLMDLIGGSFLVLVLVLLGMEYRVQLACVGQYSLLALLKSGCGLGLGWLVATLFGLAGVERAAVLVGAALPPSLLTLLFAQENRLDAQFAAGFISVAIPIYLVVMVPWLGHF